MVFLGEIPHLSKLVDLGMPRELWVLLFNVDTPAFTRGLIGFIPFLKHFLTRMEPLSIYALVSLLLYAGYALRSFLSSKKKNISLEVSAFHILILFVVSLWLIFSTIFPFTISSQGYFFIRVIPPLVVLILITLVMLVLGRYLLQLFKVQAKSFLIESVVSLGLGAVGLMTALWVLALLHIYTMLAGWILIVAILIFGRRQAQYWVGIIFHKKWNFESKFISWRPLLFWLLVSLFAFNFLAVVRPFPIGWDDLGRYLNGPRQMSLYGFIIPGMSNMQWEYITALGYVLFGYGNTFSAVLAQEINWMSGAFVVFAIIVFAKMILGSRAGLLAGLFYYSLPMVGHFSFADMKTENALLFFGTVGMICVFEFLNKEEERSEKKKGIKALLFIAGLMFAAGFATKMTLAPMLFMSVIILVSGILGAYVGFGASLLCVAFICVVWHQIAFSILETLSLPSGSDHQFSLWVFTIIFLIVGLAFVLIPVFKKNNWLTLRFAFVSVGIMALGFLSISLPWMAHLSWVSHGGEMANPSGINTLTPFVAYRNEEIPVWAPKESRALPEELRVDMSHPYCSGELAWQEITRYQGRDKGRWHYLGLPWRIIMNSDVQGYYVTLSPLLLLLPLILLYSSFWKNRSLKLLFFGTTFVIFVWIFISFGVPWYGIGMFLGFSVLAEAFLYKSPTRSTRVITGILIFIAIAMSLSLRMELFERQNILYAYARGEASAKELQDMFAPDYSEIAERIEELSVNPNRPNLYRTGTFISYFIPRNLEIITKNDTQLGFFDCINQEEDHELTLQRLKALGFHSILFDTNVSTIESDKSGPLHKRTQRFIDFAEDPDLGIEFAVKQDQGRVWYLILP